MISNKLSFLSPGSTKYNGKPDEYAHFITNLQLTDASNWEKFVSVFGTPSDVHDLGWRGEYWGKMMRGACLVYGYTANAALYAALEKAVRGLLSRADEFGRISTYDVENEFLGWDMWSRKYVLTGLQHFYDICSDEALKAEILSSMCAQADYITAKIGNESEGKLEITKTSNFWLGVNSCTILEPIVRLYTMTNDKKYLDFAEYIISTGGIDHELSLIDLACENKKNPFEYPETKAYETMSFFEGVLAYYCITGEERLFTAVKNFVEAVAKTDITIIGCSGCTHELFDNSYLKQTEYSEIIMQETCVSVTWMRLNAKLALLTGKSVYLERIEHTAYNALYGSINTENRKMYSRKSKSFDLTPMPFDSYSPLYNNTRNKGIGGFKEFADGTFYGCCICISAAGIGLLPLVSALKSQNGLYIGTFLDGEINAGDVSFTANTSYPASPNYTLTANCNIPEGFELRIRVPEGLENINCKFGEEVLVQDGASKGIKDGYITLTKAWKKGESLVFTADAPYAITQLNGKIAFTKGVLVLARDSKKESAPGVGAWLLKKLFKKEARKPVDLTAEIGLDPERKMHELTPQKGETVRVAVMLDNKTPMLLTDYASCGKKWDEEDALMSVWINIKK